MFCFVKTTKITSKCVSAAESNQNVAEIDLVWSFSEKLLAIKTANVIRCPPENAEHQVVFFHWWNVLSCNGESYWNQRRENLREIGETNMHSSNYEGITWDCQSQSAEIAREMRRLFPLPDCPNQEGSSRGTWMTVNERCETGKLRKLHRSSRNESDEKTRTVRE